MMGTFWKTTPAQRAEIIRRYALGEVIKSIAFDFNITDRHVINIALKAGLAPRGAGNRCQRPPSMSRSPK